MECVGPSIHTYSSSARWVMGFLGIFVILTSIISIQCDILQGTLDPGIHGCQLIQAIPQNTATPQKLLRDSWRNLTLAIMPQIQI